MEEKTQQCSCGGVATHARQVVLLWIHESERIYGDRLVSPSDLKKYRALAADLSKKMFGPSSVENEQIRTVDGQKVGFEEGRKSGEVVRAGCLFIYSIYIYICIYGYVGVHVCGVHGCGLHLCVCVCQIAFERNQLEHRTL